MKRLKIWAIPAALFGSYFAWTSIIALKNSIWHDESYTYLLTTYNYSEIIHRTSFDVHPPLYYFVVKVWMQIFGSSIYTMRLMSIIMMAAGVFIFWRILVREFALKAKQSNLILAAMLFGVYTVRYGQEARMYGMGTLITAICVWYFIKVSRQEFKWWKWLGLGAMLSVGFYTQYLLVFLPITLSLFLITSKYLDTKKLAETFKYSFWRLAAMGVGFIAVAAPWLPTAIHQKQSVDNGFWIGPVTSSTFIDYPTSYIMYENNWEQQGFTAVLGVLLTLLCAVSIWGFFRYRQSSHRFTLLASSFVAVPFSLLVLFSLPPFQPAFHNRYLSFYGPIFYAAVVLGILLVKNKYVRYTALGLLLVGYLYGGKMLYRQGNGATFDPKPYFSMKHLYGEIAKTDPKIPVVTDALWNYFDTYYYAKADGRITHVMRPNGGIRNYGNGSVIHGREDLQTNFPEDVKTNEVWLIEGDKNHEMSDKIPSTWKMIQKDQQGYAKIMLYEVK